MNSTRIYLDYNATSPVAPDALKQALPFLKESFGNASSLHREGQRSRAALNRARSELAGLLGCQENELLFTSGATEALNQVILALGQRFAVPKGHIITTQVEHPAVLEPCRVLERQGWRMTYLAVDGTGRVDPQEVTKAVRPDTRLIAVLHAHNEIGTLQPIKDIGRAACQARVPLLTDAVQTLGKCSVDLAGWGAAFAAFSAHKVGGFKGTGLLYIQRDQDMVSFIHGGSQERGHRAGTENVAGIVAFAEAALQAERQRDKEAQRLRVLRDRLQQGLQAELKGLRVSGHPTERLPNTLHVAFKDIEGEQLLMSLDLAGIAVSNGSACNSGSVEPSHVMTAIGLPKSYQRGTIRFSLGWGTTHDEIEEVIHRTSRVVRRLQTGRKAC